MNGNTSGRRGGHRWAGLPRAGVLATAVAAAVLIAGCGGGGAPAAGGSKAGQKALAFAHCMRSHGEPNFPDPASNGTISTGQIDMNGPQYRVAFRACGQLGGGVQLQLSAAQQRKLIKDALTLGACMRAHGIADFPDPTVDLKSNSYFFEVPKGAGKSRPYQSAWKACQ